MSNKPTYEELKQRIKELEKETTELRREKETYRVERDELRSLMNGLSRAEIGIDIVGVDYTVLFQNQILKERFGSLTGQFCYEKYMGLEDPCDFCPVIEAIRNNKIERFELTGKDGRNYEVLSTPLPNPDGTVDKAIEVVIDITERKQAEESLRIEKEFTETALNAQQDTFFLFEPATGKAIRWNRAFNNITGYNDEEIAGMVAPDTYYNHDDLERAGIFVQDILDKGIGTIELELICKDGRKVPTEYKVSVIKDEEGKPKYLISIGRDVTKRKQAMENKKKLETQLQQAQKMDAIGRLAGGVAHDFNNMLSIILGNADLALVKLQPSDVLYKELCEIVAAGKRSVDLTQQLLAFARKQTIVPKVFDLNDTVERMIKMMRRLIGEGIDLLWKPTTNLCPVKMDSTQIDQILANLMINARDAIRNVGKVTIKTENVVLDEAYCTAHAGFVPGQYILLAVSDNGYGMDRETLTNIFEPFFTTKELGKGTGLGLATVYGIVKQNNGFINVYSEPKEGTTFKIYLPRYAEKITQASSKGPAEEVRGGTETVLVVEDEPMILKMTQIMLEKLGYKILTGGTPGEAIHIAEEYTGEIHLLMTDVVMPKMNGRDLANLLSSFYPNLRCLFMSGYTANVIVHHGVLDGGVHFIQKPFSMKKLAVKVRAVLDQL
ncbi:MAG TPA: PAS domain S-box protein [Desulfatiglandales bacterium]|nr:PAS domain S-box protein [Desulfatiglandales bacterium]